MFQKEVFTIKEVIEILEGRIQDFQALEGYTDEDIDKIKDGYQRAKVRLLKNTLRINKSMLLKFNKLLPSKLN